MSKTPFKVKGLSYLVDTYAVEIMVPSIYKDKGMMEQISTKIDLYGVVVIRVYDSKGSHDKQKPTIEYPLGICNIFTTIPREMEKVEDTVYGKKADYNKLIYYKDDVFIEDKNVITDADNIAALFSLFDDGKIDSFPYLFIIEILSNNVYRHNGSNPSAPSETFHAIIADKYRDPKNINRPVRHMKDIPDIIVPLNPRELVSTGSTSNMLAFEDMNTALLLANNKAKKGDVDEMTPVEKVLQGIRE